MPSEVSRKCFELRADGWVPHRLVHTHDAKPMELTNYPFPSDDGGSILVHARTVPGDPTTNTIWIVVGEKIRPTDEQATGLRDLRLMTVQCPNCRMKWQPKVEGEFLHAHITCERCRYDYLAVYDNGKFVGFAFHGEFLITKGRGWTPPDYSSQGR